MGGEKYTMVLHLCLTGAIQVAVSNLDRTGPDAPPAKCPPVRSNPAMLPFTGTPGNDFLRETPVNDVLSGPAEIIREGVDGLLVPVGDEVGLAEAMIRVIEDDGLSERLVGAAAERIKEFRIERIMNEYEALFADVIRRSSDE